MFTSTFLDFRIMGEENKKEAEDFISGANKIHSRTPQVIAVNGKVYKVYQLRKFARYWIDKLNREAYWCEQMSKNPITLRQSHKIARKLNTLHAKIAAIHILGIKSLIPFVFAIKWRLLMTKYDEDIATINHTGYTGDSQINFSSTNWEITKLQLARSINLIGAGLKDLEKRMLSARKQAEEDATPKKAGNK
jgi:hypothetical protein